MTRTDLTQSQPREVWSINLTGVRFGLAIILQILAIVGISWGAVQWAGGTIFEKQLDRFHEKAQPSIERIIDDKIEIHRYEATEEYNNDLGEINERLGRIDEHSKDVDRRLINIEQLLWDLKNGG